MTSPITPVALDALEHGGTLPACTVTPRAEDVRAYLEATGEPVERWGETVPPLMLVAWMIGALMERIEIPDRLLHTGQEFEMHRPLRTDEVVELRFTVASLSVRRGATMAAFAMDALADDEVVATARASVLVPPAEDGGAA